MARNLLRKLVLVAGAIAVAKVLLNRRSGTDAPSQPVDRID